MPKILTALCNGKILAALCNDFEWLMCYHVLPCHGLEHVVFRHSCWHILVIVGSYCLCYGSIFPLVQLGIFLSFIIFITDLCIAIQ